MATYLAFMRHKNGSSMGWVWKEAIDELLHLKLIEFVGDDKEGYPVFEIIDPEPEGWDAIDAMRDKYDPYNRKPPK